MSWYKESQSDLGANEYLAPVKPDIFGPSIEGKNFTYKSEVIRIPLVIRVDMREWGINGINMYASGTVAVPIKVNEWGDDKDIETEKVIQVDLNELHVDKNHKGEGVYGVEGLVLHLREDFSVDYRDSFIAYTTG